MTRINWDEVGQLRRLDEIIAYCIITLEEAYTALDNEDLDTPTKNDIGDWVRWEIAYDGKGRAYLRYAAALYVVDKHPMSDLDFMSLIVAPTKYLVKHKALGLDARDGDTSLTIARAEIPERVDTLERLLFWSIVLGEWWNRVLRYLTFFADLDPLPVFNWGDIPVLAQIDTEESNTIDAQFDEYNGTTAPDGLPEFLQHLLDDSGDGGGGAGGFQQDLDLPPQGCGDLSREPHHL